jgi:hypothetical protein
MLAYLYLNVSRNSNTISIEHEDNLCLTSIVSLVKARTRWQETNTKDAISLSTASRALCHRQETWCKAIDICQLEEWIFGNGALE